MSFACHWEIMKSWVKTNILLFVAGTNCFPSFEVYMEIFNVQGAWHSPNKTPTMVRGLQACRFSTQQLPIKSERMRQLCD